MSKYQYPRVNRPSAQQPQLHIPSQDATGAEADSRPYSWVNTARESIAFRGTPGQSNIPPLPQLPEHLNPALHAPQVEDSYSSEPAPDYPIDQKTDTGEYAMQPTPQHSYPGPPAPDNQPAYHRSTPSNTAPEVIKHEYLPVSKAITYTVAPDANPLTPTTPTYPPFHTNTTNLPIIPSSEPIPSLPSSLPSHLSHPIHVPHGGTWKHALCSCADTSTCLTGLFCPCVVYGKTQHRLALRSDKKDPTNMLGYSALNGSCAVFAVLCGCNWILAAIQHTRIRKMYGMGAEAGSVGDDCVKALCCCCCTLAQDEKEVKWREVEARMSGDGLMRQGTVQYQAPSGMSYPGPPR